MTRFLEIAGQWTGAYGKYPKRTPNAAKKQSIAAGRSASAAGSLCTVGLQRVFIRYKKIKT